MSTRLPGRIEHEPAAARGPVERVRLQQDRAVALTRLGRDGTTPRRRRSARSCTPFRRRCCGNGGAHDEREHAALARIAKEAIAHEPREARRLLEDVATESGQ